MFPRKSKICIIAAFAAATMSMAITAQAAEISFRDVPLEHTAYTAVSYMVDEGITSGITSEFFGVDSPITVEQLCVFLVRAFGAEAEVKTMNSDKQGVFCSASNIAFERGWVSGVKNKKGIQTITSQYRKTPINREGLYRATLAAYGIETYDDSMYGDKVYDDLGHEYRGAIRIAHQMGLTDDYNCIKKATRGEAAVLITSLKDNTEGLKDAELPTLLQRIKVTTDEGRRIEKSYVTQIAKLPDKVIKTLADNGWSYHIGTEYIDDYNRKMSVERPGFKAVGLTSSSKKTCFLGADYSAIHETAHALDLINKEDDEELEALYQKEGSALGKLFRDYSNTDRLEFYADSFLWYIENQNNQQKLNQFKRACPETYRFLENEDWFAPVEWPESTASETEGGEEL